MAYENTCLFCGEVIPEGRQVCPKCEELVDRWNSADRSQPIMFDEMLRCILDGYSVVKHEGTEKRS